MSASDAVRQRIALVSGAGGAKRHLMHPFNGRFHPIDHAALDVLIDAMVARIDVTAVDYVLGFPEGGSVPAYAFGRAVGRPVILASRLPLDLPDRVSFEQPQANLGTTQYVYGLKPGDRVMIFEDELTNGHTAVNAVRALRRAGIEIAQIATLFAIDHPALWRRVGAEGVTLEVGVTLPLRSRPARSNGGGVIRVAFFAALRFHAPILAPVRDALGGRAETLLAGDRRSIVAFAPHVVVMAASAHLEYFRHHLPRAFIVNVRHGLIGKQGLRRLPKRASARRFDAVCVGDALRKAHYERAGARPDMFWDTGYPQMDPLFRRDPPPALPLDPARPTLLYAPTWNLGLSSAAMLGERLVDLVRAQAPGLNIIIKPHPVIGDWRPRWMAGWARLAGPTAASTWWRHPRRRHAVSPRSDVLLSDASSVVFEFLALDRPIVLMTNPRHRADPAWLETTSCGDGATWATRSEMPANCRRPWRGLSSTGRAGRAPAELCPNPLRLLHRWAERRPSRRAHPGCGPPSRARRDERPPRSPRRGAGTTCAPGCGITRRCADRVRRLRAPPAPHRLAGDRRAAAAGLAAPGR